MIEFFEASIEGTEIGLALIVLGLSCFLIGRKDLADLRTYQDLRENLEKTGSLAAQLVAERVDRTVSQLPVQAAHLGTIPDLEGILEELEDFKGEDGADRDLSGTLERAERGLGLLQAIKDQELPLRFPG